MKPFVAATLVLGTLLAGCTTPNATSSAPAKAAPPAPAAKAKPVVSTAAAKTQKTAAAAAPVSAPPVVASTTVALPPAELPPAKLTRETAALVERFTQSASSNSAHELADSTGFPEAMASLQRGVRPPKVDSTGLAGMPPATGLTADGNSTELIERDWTGLVLVPITTSLSKAHTSEVRLLKTEAHPLHDGRVRVWTRVQNIGREALLTEIACQFRMGKESTPNSPYYYELVVPAGQFRDVFFVSSDGELHGYTVLVRNANAVRRTW